MTSWRRLSSVTSSASPIAGKAGSMASIANAFDAISAAISATNSFLPGIGRVSLFGMIGSRKKRVSGSAQVGRARQVPFRFRAA